MGARPACPQPHSKPVHWNGVSSDSKGTDVGGEVQGDDPLDPFCPTALTAAPAPAHTHRSIAVNRSEHVVQPAASEVGGWHR